MVGHYVHKFTRSSSWIQHFLSITFFLLTVTLPTLKSSLQIFTQKSVWSYHISAPNNDPNAPTICAFISQDLSIHICIYIPNRLHVASLNKSTYLTILSILSLLLQLSYWVNVALQLPSSTFCQILSNLCHGYNLFLVMLHFFPTAY